MPAPLRHVRACVFDAYGTLFDFASAAAACRDMLGEQTDALTRLWREKQLQYTWLRSLQGKYADFAQVTSDALDFALDTLGANSAVRERLLRLYRLLACFPEVPGLLAHLKAAGMKLAILSNGSPAMLSATLHHNGLNVMFDAVLSVDELRLYKPHPAVYQLAVDRLGLAPEQLCFVSANAWDAWAAAAFGLPTVWCNRERRVRERLPGEPHYEIPSLALLPPLLGL